MGKNVLITGCSTGIGRATAEHLHAQGHRVFATARKEEDLESLQSSGITALKLDVNDSESIASALESVLSNTNNQIDVLINNAGYGQPGALEDVSRESMRAQFETNVFGLQELTNKVLPHMRKQNRGHIIHISSMLGVISMPFRGSYNASKYAVEGLADTLRMELADTNINVVLVEPGPIMSKFRVNAFDKYQTYVNKESSVYKDKYKLMEKNYQKDKSTVPFSLPASAVAEIIEKVMLKNNPRARYAVTLPAKVTGILRRVFPFWLLDKVCLMLGR